MSAFPVTRHSIVAAIRSQHADVRRSAFDALVTAYWKPVLKYVRLKWHASPDDAADLTQGFFLRAFEKEFFAGFDPARARFRTYLRTCLDGYMANARKAEARLKRGGAVTLVPIDFDEAERELRLPGGNAIDDFDAYFHREWLRGLFASRRSGCATPAPRAGVPNASPSSSSTTWRATPPRGRPTRDLARHLGLSTIDVTNELAAARREFRRFVLEALREQCATDEEFDAESRALGGG